MPQDQLRIGQRLRDIRILAGMRQAELARQVGISPSYLNLIEHGKRRIGGKLLLDLAQVLGVEPARLSRGPADRLREALAKAAARPPEAGQEAPEVARTDQFIATLPGWAGVIRAQERRIAALEQSLGLARDRIAQDPGLAAGLHDVLSAVTAIRATAAILSEGPLDADWMRRFHRNILEDADRLTEAAQGLAQGMEGGDDYAPGESFESWLAARGYGAVAAQAGAGPKSEDTGEYDEHTDAYVGDTDEYAGGAIATTSDEFEALPPAVRDKAQAWVAQAGADAQKVPEPEALEILAALQSGEADLVALAQARDVPVMVLLRRLGALPDESGGLQPALVIVDGAGAPLLKRPSGAFRPPRVDAPCPLWPVFSALRQPGQPRADVITLPGPPETHFRTWSFAEAEIRGIGLAPVVRAVMLALPISTPPRGAVSQVMGTTCRLCSVDDCTARRDRAVTRAPGASPAYQAG